jgi:hypothetical protein
VSARRLSRPFLALALVGLLAACQPAPPQAASYSGPTYVNPVVTVDTADPFVLRTPDRYYAYATGAAGKFVQLQSTTDFRSWERLGDAYAGPPRWAVRSLALTWAPAVVEVGRRFVMYLTVREASSRRMCITRAVADRPTGPFVDTSDGPLVCQRDLGGSIDPSPFRHEDGSLHLLWKSDGNCCSKPTILWSQPLTADGLDLVGPRASPLVLSLPGDGGVVENPAMADVGGQLHLLFSTGDWNSPGYAIDGATCAGPQGPCTRVEPGPVLGSNPRVAGPGGAEVFTDRTGEPWVAYHAWEAGAVGYRTGGHRALRIDRLRVGRGGVYVDGPTTVAMPSPPVG